MNDKGRSRFDIGAALLCFSDRREDYLASFTMR